MPLNFKLLESRFSLKWLQTLKKAEKGKYSPEYLQYGFISITVNGEEKGQCVVVCLKVLGNDSLKPNKLKAHLQTHPDHVNKNLSHFEALLSNTKAAKLDKTG